MQSFWSVLRRNRNYRYLWLGQVVNEVGYHFNSIAVLSLTLEVTGSGAAVGGVMIARTLPSILAAPLAGIVLDRMDRRKVMIACDLFRTLVAGCYALVTLYRQQWLLYLLSGLLMVAYPFFTSGRQAILPEITDPEDLHTANALTQTTAWLTLTFGTMLGGISAMQFGYEWAFLANACSFLFSAFAVWKIRGRFIPERSAVHVQRHFFADFTDSVAYMKRTPLIFAIALAGVGWATGGGAAQILFTLFGQQVYNAGPAGVGLIWGFAGVGLVLGGLLGHSLGRRLSYDRYLHAIWIGFFVHGVAYVLFSVGGILNAVLWITVSRVAMGANNVQNRTMLLRHVPDAMRGRIFTTVEAMSQATMMVSLTVASLATRHYSPRSIAFVAGLFSTATAIPWAWATLARKLPEPTPHIADDPEVAEPPTPA